jgi:hypothetical protein
MVVEADDAIVGYVGWLPWRLRIGPRTWNTMRLVDFAVHPAHRGGAVSALMVKVGKDFQPDGVQFMWANPNQRSRGPAFKSGHERIGAVRRFARPSRRAVIARVRAAPADQTSVQAESAEHALRDADSWLGPITQALRSERFGTDRQPDWLRWRYGRWADYRAVRAGPSDPGEGIAIFRYRGEGVIRISEICELLVRADDVPTARHLVKQVENAAPADVLSCGFSSRLFAARCGFVASHRSELITVRPFDRDVKPDPAKSTSWALSLGDFELI